MNLRIFKALNFDFILNTEFLFCLSFGRTLRKKDISPVYLLKYREGLRSSASPAVTDVREPRPEADGLMMAAETPGPFGADTLLLLCPFSILAVPGLFLTLFLSLPSTFPLRHPGCHCWAQLCTAVCSTEQPLPYPTKDVSTCTHCTQSNLSADKQSWWN